MKMNVDVGATLHESSIIAIGLIVMLTFIVGIGISIVDVSCTPADNQCQKISLDDMKIQIKDLPDGEVIYVPNDSLFIDKNRHLLVRGKDWSSLQPTNFRLFRYGKKYDLYFKHLRSANLYSQCTSYFDDIPVTNFIEVANIQHIDVDIARRKQPISQLAEKQ